MPNTGSDSNEEYLEFAKDEHGKDVILKHGKYQVMMEWEKPYMEACIDALKPSGDVLEIGFGLGYSASHIQTYNPKSHTIIECDPVVLQQAKQWSKKHPNTKIVSGIWQEKLGTLGKFDIIFFDDYSPEDPEMLKEIHQKEDELQEKVEDANKLSKALAEQMKMFEGLRFSDHDVEVFVQYIKSKKALNPQDVFLFVDKLEKQKNITTKQKVFFLQEYEKFSLEEDTGKTELNQILDRVKDSGKDRLIYFIEICLTEHMKPGSRLSSFIDYPDFKDHEDNFRKTILSRPDVACSQKVIKVEVPENCRYYKGDEALVMVIEKK